MYLQIFSAFLLLAWQVQSSHQPTRLRDKGKHAPPNTASGKGFFPSSVYPQHPETHSWNQHIAANPYPKASVSKDQSTVNIDFTKSGSSSNAVKLPKTWK